MHNWLKNIKQLLLKISTGKNVIILLVVTQTIYFTMLFYTIPNVMNYAGGMKTLDMIPTGYSADYAKSLLQALGHIGRDYYLYNQIPLDMIYPFLFAISYSILLTYLFRKIFAKDSKLQFLCFVPFFGGLFDYLENIGIINLLTSYPEISLFIVKITSLFSVLKSISTTMFFILLIVSIITIFIKKLKRS